MTKKGKKGKKHKKRQDNPPQEIKTDQECPSTRNNSDQEPTGARSDGAGPSDQSWEPSLEPKHRIFLSHSGAQKDFTWQLCEDLERAEHYPFFDRRDDSLPKGEKFPPLIIEAAKQCRVAVLVLSDKFFTRSKWPMIELNEFVMAQGSSNPSNPCNPSLKLLPLFLGITMKQFYEKERRARWFKKWEEFACEDKRIDLKEWEKALSKIPGGINAMEYTGVAEGEVVFRKTVVEAICRLLPPDVKYDVSHVQSLQQLCEPIEKKLKEANVSSKFKVQVVGLYGMGGVGKTTISRAICNQMNKDFGGKVCHVELGGNDLVEVKKRVLRELTEASASILEGDPKKHNSLLKERMHRKKVFLVLDNVWDDQVEEGLQYLHAGYHVNSMVLVTSRSLELLKGLGIAESSCLPMPNLEQEGAINVFLHYLGVSRESIVEESDLVLVRSCVMVCYFSRGEEATPHGSNGESAYHPLALKALGLQFHGLEMMDWNEIWVKLKVAQDKFNMSKVKVHPVHSILHIGFIDLNKKQQDIFMDLALIWKPSWIRRPMTNKMGEDFYMEWEWLCILHSMSEDEMIANVNALQRKGLLDKVNINMTKLEYNIHDLYVEFAKAEIQARPFEERQILLDVDRVDVLRELEMYPPHGVWTRLKRLIIYRSEVKSLTNLHHCKNVEVLLLVGCANLEEVDVTEMSNLRIVVVNECRTLGKLRGLEKLRKLLVLCWARFPIFVPVDIACSSTDLRVVRLSGIRSLSIGREFQVDLSKCTNLHEISLDHRDPHTSLVMDLRYFCEEDLGNMDIGTHLPKSVLKLDLPSYPCLGSFSIMALAAFTNLQDLNLCGCEGIEDLMDLCKLISLQKLDVRSTGIVELPDDLWKLRHLQYLDVSNCRYLTNIYNIIGATALRTVYAYGCWSLERVPDDFSKLQHLEVLDMRKADKIHSLPQDYARLAGYPGSGGILKVKVGKCWGLIEPLVQKLRGSEVSRVACEDGCNCDSESMVLWIEARKNVDAAAYDWLKDVIGVIGSSSDLPRTYLLDCEDCQAVDVVIRGLCEHDNHGSKTTNRLAAIVEEVAQSYYSMSIRVAKEDDRDYLPPYTLVRRNYPLAKYTFDWWIVVATAPCTFKATTKGAIMEPWRETLFHYTIAVVLPRFIEARGDVMCFPGRPKKNTREDDVDEDDRNNWFQEMWLYRATVAVLQKCREKLDGASEQGIDPVRCNEVKKFVSTFLCELEAAKTGRLHWDSILRLGTAWGGSQYIDGYCYNDLFANYQFEGTLATEIVR